MIYYRLKMNKFDTVCDFLYNFSGFCQFTQQAIILSGMERRKKNKRVSDFFPYTKKQPVSAPPSTPPSTPPSVPLSALPSTPPTVPSSAGKVNQMASFVHEGCKICLQKDKEVCFKTYLFIFIPSDQQTKSKLLLCLSNTITYFYFRLNACVRRKRKLTLSLTNYSQGTQNLLSPRKNSRRL